MYYSTIKDCDIANGEGVRISVFVSGCTNHCECCFQPETWNFEYGKPFTKDTQEHLLKLLNPSYIKGLSLLGGEPMEPSNQRELVKFMHRMRETLPEKNIWCFTGFTWELLLQEGSHPRCEVTDDFLSMIDVLVDGRFVQALKNPSLRFRGSSNQRLINVPETLKQGTVVELPNQDRVLTKYK